MFESRFHRNESEISNFTENGRINEETRNNQENNGLQIYFVYDVSHCRHEADDPKDAILYFHPSRIPETQRCGLCCQLMGTIQFFNSCFKSPKLITMQKAKFAICIQNNYVMALSGSRDMPDAVLLRQMDSLLDSFRFYFKSIAYVKENSENHRSFLNKLAVIWNCLLKVSQYNGDALSLTFSSVPHVQAKINKAVGRSSLELIQSCQRKPGVLAGCILYKNKVLTTQLNPSLTRKLMMIHPYNDDSFSPESTNISSRLPPGVRLYNIFLTDFEFNEIIGKNRHYSCRHRHFTRSNSLFKCRNKSFDIRTLFSAAKSSDELSTVTEETVDTEDNSSFVPELMIMEPVANRSKAPFGNVFSESDTGDVSSDCYNSKLISDHENITDASSDVESNNSTNDKNQCEYKPSSNDLVMLKHVALKSFQSTNDKLRNKVCEIGTRIDVSSCENGAKQKLIKNLIRSEPVNKVDHKIMVGNILKTKKPLCHRKKFRSSRHKHCGWNSDVQLLTHSLEVDEYNIRRTNSDTVISKLDRHSKSQDPICRIPEMMSEDSSYYSNDSSPTLVRKQPAVDVNKRKTDKNWYVDIEDALCENYADANQCENTEKTSDLNNHETKISIPKKISTVIGPKIERLKKYPKSLAISNYRRSENKGNDFSVIKGNKLSDRVSWSSSGYDTMLSNDDDLKNLVKDLHLNAHTLPNGKIVPIELGTIDEVSQKDLVDVNNERENDVNVVTPSDDFSSSSSDEFDDNEINFKKLTLYVQSYSEIILLLLLEEPAHTEPSIIQSLWRTGLSCLGDLSIDAHRFVENSRKDYGSCHKYLRYDVINKNLLSDSLPLNLDVSSDKLFSRVSQIIHEEFLENNSVTDLTIALRDTLIHGHFSGSKETYYQQSRAADMPTAIHLKNAANIPDRSLKRLESNFGSFLP